MARSRSRAPMRFGATRACTESICPKFRRSFTFLSSELTYQKAAAGLVEQSDREPGHGGDDDGANKQGQHVADHRPDALIGMNAADRACSVVSNAEWRSEQADAHRKDNDHRV